MREINIEKMQEFIDILKEKPVIKWTDSSASNGRLTLPYPIYPKWVHEFIESFPCDKEYSEKIERIEQQEIGIDSYNLEDTIAHITFIIRRERFCDGLIATNIEDGTLLKLLEKLVVLLS